MGTFAYDPRLSYRDQAFGEGLSDALGRHIGHATGLVRYDISKVVRQQIASDSDLQRHQIEALQGVSTELGERLDGHFEQLSFDLSNLSAGLADANRVLQCGFTRLLAASRAIHDKLEDLVQHVKRPSEVWSYEQFEIARDAARRKLYPEALDALHRAIHGHGDHPGYAIEFRFHYLQGLILLGHVPIPCRDLLDPAAAESSFLKAARYALEDHPAESAGAFLRAAWAAYWQGRMSEAEQHASNALSSGPELCDAWYLRAKVRMHGGRVPEAIPDLRHAVRVDRNYVLKAGGDEDFLRHQAELLGFIAQLTEEARQEAEDRRAEVKAAIEEFATWAGVALDNASPDAALESIAQGDAAAGQETYFGHLDAQEAFARAGRQATEARALRIAGVRERLESLAARTQRFAEDARTVLDTYDHGFYEHERRELDAIGQGIRSIRTPADCHSLSKRISVVDDALKKAKVRATEAHVASTTHAGRKGMLWGALWGSACGAGIGAALGGVLWIPVAMVVGLVGAANQWPDGTAASAANTVVKWCVVLGIVIATPICARLGTTRFRQKIASRLSRGARRS